MKKVLLSCFTALCAITASAMPARPGTFTVQQSDGTVLTLRMVGDEHFHFFLDVNTGRRMELAANGDYTVIPEQEFVRRQAAAKQRLQQANSLRMARMEKYQQSAGISLNPEEIAARGPHKAVGTFNNHLSGKKKGLVILVNFTNLEHSLDDPQLEWDNAFNEVGYSKNRHAGSVHDYFYDQSYGTFDLEFDVVGPVTVSKNMEYYGKNNSYGSDAHAGEMVAEACKLVNNQVNFKDYDWDGDGEVDQVYVIYAGYGESSGAPAETIWPHEYWLEYGYGEKLYLDGTYINTYACSCELRGDGRGLAVQNGIGTACHEFSHCIGYPDFYDVDYGGCFGMDEWDVLGSGGYNGPNNSGEVPAGYTAYERWMAGWLEPVELKEGAEIIDMPNLLDEPVAYILRNKNKGTMARGIDEYFLLENRQAKKWFSYPGLSQDGTQKAHGMLVTHVDYNKTAWMQNQVNVTASAQRMSIIPAGKTFGTYSSSYKSWTVTPEEYRSMLFPGPRKVKELTNESHYDFGAKLHNRNSDGTYNMNIPLTKIEEKDGKLSFLVMGGVDLGYRWTIDFEAGEGTSSMTTWQQQNNAESITLPEATPKYEGWRFFGWTTTEVKGSDKRPAEILPAGSVYQPEANVKLYAVYGMGFDGPLVDEYQLANNLEDEAKYILVSKDAASTVDIVAVDAAKLIVNTSTKTTEGTVVDVDFAAVPTVFAPVTSLIWTARTHDDLMSLTSGGNNLLISNSGLSLSDSPAYVYYDTTYGLYGKGSTGSNYYIHTSSGKFSVSTTKQKSSRVYLYKMSDFSNKQVFYTTYPVEHLDLNGIVSVNVNRPAADNVYDLLGRQAKAAAHGVFIQNGRKMIK